MTRSCIGIAIVGVLSLATAAEAQEATTGTAVATAPATATATVTVTATATATVTAPASGADALDSPVIIIGIPAAPPTYPVLTPPLPAPPGSYVVPAYAPYAPSNRGATYAAIDMQAPLADAPPGDGHRVGRIFAEAGLGLVGMLMGGLGGALVGITPCLDGGSAADDCMGSFVAGVVVGMGLGTPAGIVLAGRALDGNGGFGWTLLGTSVGFLAAGGLASSVDDADSATALALVPVLGGIFAYELSSDTSARYAERQAQGQLQASVGPTRGGAAVSVTGAF